MAVEIKPFVVGSKKATSALVGGVTAAGIGFVVFVAGIKWLGLSFKEALLVAGVFGGVAGGSETILYPLLEGLRDALGKAKPTC